MASSNDRDVAARLPHLIRLLAVPPKPKNPLPWLQTWREHHLVHNFHVVWALHHRELVSGASFKKAAAGMRRTHPLAGALADDAVAVLIEGLGQAAVIIDALWVLVLARRLEGLRARKAPVVRDRIPATRDQIQPTPASFPDAGRG